MIDIFDKENYFNHKTISFYKQNHLHIINFFKNSYLLKYVSKFINCLISNSKNSFFFCCGNSIISQFITADKKVIREVHEEYFNKYNNKSNEFLSKKIINEVQKSNQIIIADIEQQKNLFINLEYLSKNIKDDCKIIVISKSLLWIYIIKILRFCFKKIKPKDNNYLPFSNLKSLFENSNLEIVRNEKILILPIYIPIISNLINFLGRFPILNFFCLLNITILKKKNYLNKNINKISIIIPCKNEEGNIKFFKNFLTYLSKFYNLEVLFGDDQSTDDTRLEVLKLINELKSIDIKLYNAPGVSKSENVYKGFDIATGEILVITDADLTVDEVDTKIAIDSLKRLNCDMINCSRMIYPQANNAMKTLNFMGNIFFAKLFTMIFDFKITDTLCGTKVIYKADWIKIKKCVGTWGLNDLWGDFDLLLGAFKNNLKIKEVPIFYKNRTAEQTKMTSVFKNGLRMLWITIYAYFKLKFRC